MTDQVLKEAVTKALRLNAKSATALSSDIDRNIKTACLDLIRMGVSSVLTDAMGELVAEAVITYCQMKMGKAEDRESFNESYTYQADCIRKSGENYKALEEQALAAAIVP